MSYPLDIQKADLPGLTSILAEAAATRTFQDDIITDLEEEQATLPHDSTLFGDSDNDFEGGPMNVDDIGAENDGHDGGMPAEWQESMKEASKGVTDKTHNEYLRLATTCADFLMANSLIPEPDKFLSSTPLPDSDRMIVAWIMDACDTMGLDGKPVTRLRASYGHAQKMRASMTHYFGRVMGLGSQEWSQKSKQGKIYTKGNPSISEKVATYMLSLRRRKVQAGETATSARAITPAILEELYHVNNDPEGWQRPLGTLEGAAPSNFHSWAGPRHRLELQAIYTLAFICLLRVDEVLKIRWEHIEIRPDSKKMVLTLPFRKTHQFGEIKPFPIPMLSEHEAHLCPVRAMAAWIHTSKITSGYIFRRRAAGDRVQDKDVAMTSEQFLESFRNNLIDIRVEPSPYGTHSVGLDAQGRSPQCRKKK